MLTMNVISRVDQPTDWCVVTPKASGEVRICMDLTKLNQSILREAHPLPSVDFTLGKLDGSKVFSEIDANSAFWQRKLSDDSRLLTTFITPCRRFCFNRLPYGIPTGSEQFQKCMSDILKGIEGAECQVDDIIVHGCEQVQHDERLHVVLKRLADANVTLNLAKCGFSVTKVKVLGHVVSAEGISADPQKIEAIRSLPTPKNVAEVRSFLGMVNHFSKFAKHFASKTKPLRELLKKKNTWHWGQSQEQAFRESKE